MASLSLEGVSKRFRARRALVHAVRRVDLEVADGEFVVLVGPSGCGKTTTLRMIAGLEEIDEGVIRIGERVVNDVAPKDRDIAMVFQNYALYPHMTAYDNMAFALKIRKLPRAEIRRKVDETAAMLGIGHLLERKPKDLSGGERQRVAVGRAIVRRPRVFLFDEPLSNLDAKLRLHMRAELKALHQRLGVTTIYVTHDQEEAMTLGDRLVVMHEGVVRQVGSPMELYRGPANRFVAGFLGSPGMNFLPVRVNGDMRTCVVAGEAKWSAPPPLAERLAVLGERPAVVGVRPEHLRVSADGHEDPEAGGLGLHAVVSVVEPLGNGMNVHLKLADGHALIARVAPTESLVAGERARVTARGEDLHVFPADE